MALLSRCRRPALAAALAVVSAVALVREAGAQAPVPADEYRLKAAIIYSLTKFVEWPSTAFANPASPFTVCVLGTDPFGPALDEAMRGRTVAGRTVATRRMMTVEPGCHVVFVAASESRRLAAVLEQLRGQHTLSIGEDTHFLDGGGMVALTLQGDRVRFAIRHDVAERAHLRVSARLLVLAGAKNGGAP